MNEHFKQWVAGYSGFDGGNKEGKVWLCGIEWGGKSPSCIEELEALFLEDVSEIPTGYACHETNLKFDYNKRFIHIIGSMKDENFSSDNKNLLNERIKKLNDEEKFFTKKSNYLKLNLSPLNFPNTDGNQWDDKYKKLTAYSTKSEYEEFAWETRKKLFNEMVDSCKPKLIITFGASNKYINRYKEFFKFDDINLEEISYVSDKRLSLRYGCKVDNNGNKILLINTYFPSNGWLTSSKSLHETGRIINELLNKYDIEI